ncbi:hypothetical protein HanXRQr2_Chr17g0785091 [Helianthus annuus]|uniref:Uncharacterized protein n=1 Tax=Helianthus annuus TaxID=4232 RepID=A0A9K3GT50_HELAN|nr:hypothetical protein HanXRQr2_Chr17g0785091 [Helianthus annuus]
MMSNNFLTKIKRSLFGMWRGHLKGFYLGAISCLCSCRINGAVELCCSNWLLNQNNCVGI